MSSDYHNKSIYRNSDRPSSKVALYTLLAIVALVFVYGWMDRRDTEITVMTYECAPEIEMSMPIKVQS